MKTKILLLAVTALTFVACSSDETTAVNQNDVNAISFRAFVGGTTRTLTATTAASFTTSSSFYAEAWTTSGETHTKYFDAEQFLKGTGDDASNYRSTTKHYWPATGSLDFIAYYPNVGSGEQLTHTAWNTFTLVPAEDVANHKDYVIAATLTQAKAASVPLAFKHLGAWVVVKAYNSKNSANDNMTTTVSGWKIGYLYNGGVYTVSATTVDGTALPTGWDYTSYARVNDNVPYAYKKEFTAREITPTASGSATEIGDAIIVPQNIPTALSSTSTYGTGGFLTGAFIAVKLLIQDKATPTAHTLADATGNDGGSPTSYDVWAIWPIANNFEAGKKYTYTIDLSQGGYKEKGTAGNTLEKWLDGAEIFFSGVTVTDWNAGTSSVVEPS